MSTPVAPEDMTRRQQLVATYRMAKATDPRIGLWSLLAALVGGALGFAVMWFLPGGGILQWVFSVVGTILFALVPGLILFGRRAQKAAFSQMEGQKGAAAQALTMLRRGWRTDPLVAFNKQQDIVHRVVGPPGIVLVGEGNPSRVRTLLAAERRKLERVAADAPIHEVLVGRGEGEVPLPRLVRHVQKLGRKVKPAEITDILNRLKALDASRPNMPIPKGPLPTSMKGQRGNLRGR